MNGKKPAAEAARRRKKFLHGTRQQYIALGLAVFFGLLLALRQKNTLSVNYGFRKQEAENLYRELLAENTWLNSRLINLKSAPRIRAALEALNLPLKEPEAWNVFYLGNNAGAGAAEGEQP